MLMPGDMVALSGELGTGKTTIARALVREIAADERLDVPSPTFTILQLYELPRARLVHADLYRVADPSELEEIGWDELRDGAITLVEWPDRAGGAALAPDRLDIALSMPPGADADGAARAPGRPWPAGNRPDADAGDAGADRPCRLRPGPAPASAGRRFLAYL